jgi:ribose transport system permease protein
MKLFAQFGVQLSVIGVLVAGLAVVATYRPARAWLERRATLKRLAGVVVLVLVLYEVLMFSNFRVSALLNPELPLAERLGFNERTSSLLNHQNLGQRLGFYGVLTLGVGVLIISGGIDLSIGSVVGLAAVSLALMLEKGPFFGLVTRDSLGGDDFLLRLWPFVAAAVVVAGSCVIGLIHGLLVTKLGLQPFLVTLCGLFIYRGLAQWATRTPQGSPRDVGIGGVPDLEALRFLAVGRVGGVPVFLLLMLGIAALVAVLLHLSVYGRYIYAVGYNEQAARYAGVATDRSKILAYVLCSSLAGLGGVQHMLDLETASPTSTGSWLELYAITGAVLGGCSLRGGEGTVAGMLLGAAVLPLLWNLCNFVSVLNVLQFAVIGAALLLGTIVDEVLKRRSARQR